MGILGACYKQDWLAAGAVAVSEKYKNKVENHPKAEKRLGNQFRIIIYHAHIQHSSNEKESR